MWAHAEYIKLLRSTADGKVYDTIPEVADRYLKKKRSKKRRLEIWKFIRQVRFIEATDVLRIFAETAFSLRWSSDDWQTFQDAQSAVNALHILLRGHR